ncbi:MAG: chorismate-binding protein [Muribaculaceae bacterium]
MIECSSSIHQAINRAINLGARFFAYRLPDQSKVVFGAQTGIQPCHDSFIIHPFAVNGNAQPTTIARQLDADEFLKLNSHSLMPLRHINNRTTSQQQYLHLAMRCINSIRQGDFQKIVLSRVIVNSYNGINWAQVFHLLAQSNPHAMTFVFNTPETGAWMGATPERLISCHNGEASIMALAATKEADSSRTWSQKEVLEQKCVANFIAATLNSLHLNFNCSPTYNRIAANVQHLCNDFTLSNVTPQMLPQIIGMLHPTPAISGDPQRKAVDFLVNNEEHQRLYYGGYLGPADAHGNVDYFVNLRSLNFSNSHYCIYAGGGLTADSVPINEWQETELKAHLIKQFIN